MSALTEPSRTDAAAPPRSHGSLAVAVSLPPAPPGASATPPVRPARLDRLRQAGCMKLRFPGASAQRGGRRTGVMINSAGGLTGGDCLTIDAAARDGARLTLTTQAAERVYRAESGVARLETRLTLGAGAGLAWLPQETILFDGGALERRLDLEAAEDAGFLLCEPVILGRMAMGETVRAGHWRESWRVRVGGRLVFADEQRLNGAFSRFDAAPALAGDRAFATILMKSPAAEAHLEAVRAHFGPGGGASLVAPDLLVARLTASNGAVLRRRLVPVLEGLAGEALPRVWSM